MTFVHIQKWIDIKNKRCKYIRILQELKKIFQKLRNYNQKGLSCSDAYLHCTGSYLMHIDFATQIFNDK